jgi:hypothetical protein
MKGFADEMAAVEKRLDDEDVINPNNIDKTH